MATDNTNGRMDQYMWESFRQERNMAKENGRRLKMNLIATSMKDSTRMIRKTDMVFSTGNLVTSIKVIMLTMNVMALVRCSGQMDQGTKESGNVASSLATER